ncbi:hypothetical protein SPHINGO8BC_140250 [Sphingobacterium multivorum]|uniref:Uncharacterized protein n=1 Tax=Sphingobacterium multivorum TaxID=28454 RepID=A0A653ZNZ0_SPHMU|nr:hypothetical protein SPHINGO8BC_140250 [Sphingobacterium multivorum]
MDFESIEKNPNMLSILTYLGDLFTEDKIELKSIYEYLLIDVDLLNN